MKTKPDSEWVTWSKAYLKRWEADKLKRQAQAKVARALRNGTLKRASCCGSCWAWGIDQPNVVAYHEDYTKPLEVIWLCRKCHKKKHISHELSRPKEPNA